MILVVCLNLALDVTHHVPAVDWSGVNRPTAVYARPGGKGVNVARTLHALGADVVLAGLAGGATGSGLATALRELGIPTAFTAIAAENRRTFAVVDSRGAVALFNEAGPEVTAGEFGRFRDQYRRALASAAAVVLSGSLPPGLPPDTYATLIELAGTAVPVILDTHGDALLPGVAAGPAIVKPNLDELQPLVTRRLSTPDGIDWAAVTAATARLRAAGAGAVVASLGPEGLLAETAAGRWKAWPSAPVTGNATGAGDAVAAALAHGLVLGRPWDERLRHAVALGAASVTAPAAGEFSRAAYTSGLSTVAVTLEEAR
jgi:1-phosphofructokinase family hexose kinase